MRFTDKEREERFAEVLNHREEIKHAYDNHEMDVRKLAAKYGIGRWQMQSFMIKMGIEIHKPLENKMFITDDKTLIELFNDCIPVNEIAEKMNSCRGAVERRVKELGLVRPKSMMARDFYDSSNDDKIIKLYEDGKSSTEIAEIIGVAHSTVLNHLRHCGIKVRDAIECQFNYDKKEMPKVLTSFESLYDLYVVQRLSKKDIAALLNITPCSVDTALKKFNIHIRNNSESRMGLYTGVKHPNWKDGRTPLYARLRMYFKCRQVKAVLKRDGYTCQLCGSTKKLQVHHIRRFRDIFNEILSEHPDLDVQKDINELYEIMVHDERMT